MNATGRKINHILSQRAVQHQESCQLELELMPADMNQSAMQLTVKPNNSQPVCCAAS